MVAPIGGWMECGSCGTPNRDNAKFCAECGAPGARRCDACGNELRPAAKFCDGCGTPVAAGSSPDAVRKTVTVLFCDLAGSTAFEEVVDAEAAREAMGRYHSMVESVIRANGGMVAKFIGDGAMALFGVPEVAEDDAHRAIAAGLELQSRFVGIADHIRERHGVEVALRVGVNTGEIVVADDDADIVGDAINTAARLEAACPPGGVLTGEDTWRLTRSTIEYETLGDVEVKGKAEPLATFQVVAEAAPLDETATPFVGRDCEMAELTRVYGQAVDARAARLVTVVGAPGVGKTRLAHELVRGRADEAFVFETRCERSGTATFAPMADLLRSAAGIAGDEHTEAAVAAIGELVDESAPDRDRLIELLGSLVVAAVPRSTEEMFFAVRRLLEILGRRRPVVVVVDDIQWAEPLLLDLLEHLTEWIDDAPVVIVALARPEIRDVRSSLAEPGGAVARVLSIEGLDPAATQLLAARLLGAERLPPDLTARLPESTEGNPLFVRELIRMLVDDGVVSPTEHGWELAIDAEAVEVPPTIQSLLATRVERMPVRERRMVELAAVVGPEFARGAVAAVADGFDGYELDAVLEQLRRKQIVDSTGTYWGDEPIFRFHHVLIRDAAYRRLLKGARADLHVRVGEWTEQRAADLVGEHEASVAFHFEQAFAYRHELGVDDDETAALGRRAAALLESAATRALERDDLAAAGGLAGRALGLLARDAPNRSDLLLVACEALLGSGDVAEGRRVLDELDAAAADPRLEAWATCFHGQLINLSEPDGLSSAEASLAAAAERLAGIGDEAGVAKARQVRAGALARLGRVGECEAELDLALTAARAADDRRRVTAVLGAAPVVALWGPSPVPRAGGRCLDVIRLLRITTGSPAVEATSVRCQAVLEALRGRFDTARTMLAAARATAEEVGLRQGLMETELYAGIVELLADDPSAAESHLRVAHGELGRLGIGADAGQAAAHLARALLLQGRLDEADGLAAESDALAGQNPQTLIAARSVQAEILAARGEHDEALALAEAAVAMASGRDIVVDHANANVALGRVRAITGDGPGADAAFAEARRLFELKGAAVAVDMPRSGRAAEESSNDPAAGEETEPSLRNDATELNERIIEVLDGPGVAGLAGLIAADARREDRRSLVGIPTIDGGDSWIESLLATREAGFSGVEQSTITVRGERFALAEWVLSTEKGGESSSLVLSEVADGRLVRAVFFDPDDLVAAVEELDRSDVDERARAASQQLISPEVVDDDRRPSIVEDDGHSAEGLLEPVAARDASPLESAATRAWVAGVDSLAFAENQLDRALVQFDELSAGSAPTARRSMANEATWLSDRLGELARGGSFDELAASIDPDAAIVDRSSFGEGEGGREAFVAAMRTWQRVWADQPDRGGPVAIRADRLALVEYRFGTHGDWRVERLGVVQVDEDGLLAYLVFFDPDDLPAAVAELDRLYLNGLDALEAMLFREHLHFCEAVAVGDLDRALGLLSEDSVVIDHRSLGSGPQSARERLVSLVGSVDAAFVYATEVHRLGPRFTCLNNRYVLTTPDGERAVQAAITVSERDPATGLLVRSDIFGDDQLDAALALLDERIATAATDVRAVNRATWAGVALDRIAYGGAVEDLALGVAESCDMVDEDGSTRSIGRRELIDGTITPADLWFGVDRRWLIAVRGETLALVGKAQDDGGLFLAIEELDERGLLSRCRRFGVNRLRDAVDALNQMWLEHLELSAGDVPAPLAVLVSFNRANSAYDVDEKRQLLADDFEQIDHRPLGLPTMDRDQLLEATVAVADSASSYVSSVVHAVASHGAVASVSLVGAGDFGEWTEAMPSIAVMFVRGDELARVELYAEDDVLGALARFEELGGLEI